MKRLVVAALVLSACSGSSGDSGPDGGASLACSHFSNVANDAADGVLAPSELRDKIKEVESNARVSREPGVADSARRMLAAITDPIDSDAYAQAVSDFVAACNASVD